MPWIGFVDKLVSIRVEEHLIFSYPWKSWVWSLFTLCTFVYPILGGVGSAVGNVCRELVVVVTEAEVVVWADADAVPEFEFTGNAFNPGASPSSSGKFIWASASVINTNNKYIDRQPK